MPRPFARSVINALLSTVLLAALSISAVRVAAQQRGERDGAVLDADRITFDESSETVEADGNVQVLYDDYILYADRLIYDQARDRITASGNVALLDNQDNVVFGERIELSGDLRDGVIEGVGGLLSDDSRLAARRGRRESGTRTILENAVYSPCDLCPPEAPGEKAPPPIWQIKASKVTHDTEAKDVIYRDARLELGGVPVAYTPYFSHPDPSVRARTGFLTPSAGFDGNLGAFVRSYYYLDLEPNYDATIETSWTGESGLLGGLEWRHRLPYGSFEFLGSITSGERDQGTVDNPDLGGKGVRGHLFGSGRFDLSDEWRAGFDVQVTSDDNYLRIFDYSEDDILVTEGRIEGFFGNNYASLRGFFVDDLRPGSRPEQPIVLPTGTASFVGEPRGLIGGRWQADGTVLSLTRTPGQDVHRLTAGVRWDRQAIAPFGLITDLTTAVESAGYWIFNRDPVRADAEESSDVAGRVYTNMQAIFRYPLARPLGNQSLVLEPTAGIAFLPETFGDDSEIPNEDSTDVELDATNLFSLNRFPGRDRIEDGARTAYGLKAGLYGFENGGFVAGFIGQSRRFSGDEDFPTGSGLEGNVSDYVGYLQASPGPYLDLEYRFRVDDDDFEGQRHELGASFGTGGIRFFTNYLFVQAVEGTGIAENRNELTLIGRLKLNKRWRVAARTRNQLGADSQFLRAGAQIVYEDECFRFAANLTRDGTDRIGDDNETAVFFQIAFKNLGGFGSPNLFSELAGFAGSDDP